MHADRRRALKLLAAEGESIPGGTFRIGNTNSRLRFASTPAEFLERWCAEGPTHHVALGVGHVAADVRRVASLLGARLRGRDALMELRLLPPARPGPTGSKEYRRHATARCGRRCYETRCVGAGWDNYSLFLREDGLLVGYLETRGTSRRAQAAMEATGVNARWQAEMAAFFELGDGERPDTGFVRLEEIFHVG